MILDVQQYVSDEVQTPLMVKPLLVIPGFLELRDMMRNLEE
jgi:hypothetical protein